MAFEKVSLRKYIMFKVFKKDFLKNVSFSFRFRQVKHNETDVNGKRKFSLELFTLDEDVQQLT